MNSRYLNNTTSWTDFASHLAGLNSKEKGDAFESLVSHYLRLQPIYATQLETVWLLQNVPNDVSKILNLPTSDEGIDLIARTKEGGYTKGLIPGKAIKPEDIPADPRQTYSGKGWKGMRDWLGKNEL